MAYRAFLFIDIVQMGRDDVSTNIDEKIDHFVTATRQAEVPKLGHEVIRNVIEK